MLELNREVFPGNKRQYSQLSWSLIGRCAKLPTANKMILALPFEKILHRWKMPVAHWPAKDITATKQKSLCFRGHSCTSSPYDRSHYICVCYFGSQSTGLSVSGIMRGSRVVVDGVGRSSTGRFAIFSFFNITAKLEWRTREKLGRSWRFMIDSSIAKRPLQSLAITGGNLS